MNRSSAYTGVTFKNELIESPELNILNYLYYYNGAGVASGDFNNDGLTDLYFTSNQGADKLYLNKGQLKFEDITEMAEIDNTRGWTTGVTHVDINSDGLLDIYICKVGNYRGVQGKNLLYVNQGINEKGVPSFKEEASKYNLDFSGFSTQASFFDYDLDGDLDMYLLNHSVNVNRSYGKGAKRKSIDSLSGDILYRNDNGKFKDVSKEAGIFQGNIGYGLGLGISDLNNNGYPDIYVGNDFFENDYLYINQKDGTFKEVISENETKLGHTSHFSMGNDLADINNDGYTDIVSLDMLPEDLETYKTSGLEYGFPIYQQYLKNGYAPQYMQNTLHLNLDGEHFSEIAHLSGLNATEWSWGTLLADFDNDGFKDVFVSNGIKGATNDMDFINYISNDHIQKTINTGLSKDDMAFIDHLPSKKVPNYFFKNNGDITFSNMSGVWSKKIESYSNGCTYADLDNDGDLDVIVNNVDEEAFILENTLVASNHLEVKFSGGANNKFGIGAKVILYQGSNIIAQENFVSRGYLSAKNHTLHFGIGNDSIIDSIQVIWPGGKYQTLKNITLNKTLSVSFTNAAGNYYTKQDGGNESFFSISTKKLGFVHQEQQSLDFDRDPLVPFSSSNEGPSVSVADVNNDGLEDLFISGAKKQASVLFLQNELGDFQESQSELFELDKINEDIDHTFFDADNDGNLDLIVVSGGNEFIEGKPLTPRLYLNKKGQFTKDAIQFGTIEVNASKVAAVDIDNDGDQDICITSDLVPGKFGETPKQYLFSNDGKGNFTETTSTYAPEFETIGNIKDIVWQDLDNNGYPDLIVVGHWGPITIFLNNGNKLVKQRENGLEKTHGWWNSVETADMDNDGDLDILAGNWGLNTKFKASLEKPITLYKTDFDENGSVETLVTHFHGDKETAFASKDELAKQMPVLNKKFLFYKDFAKASLEDIFGKEKLDKASKKQIYQLGTSYFENDGNGHFSPKNLPLMVQSSTVNNIYINDIDGDGYKDALFVGNNFEISTQLGRLDASHGLLLQNDGNGNLTWKQNLKVSGAARKIEKIIINGREEFIITLNNDSPVFLVKKHNTK
ncbi:VCBS repeat-containing protein [Flagellimonas sp.]|uniref:VCBS repeat-containing protein n=1 Tax=Flagellimonas sp. TaxID=2058762 RepID=UPI003B5A0FAF